MQFYLLDRKCHVNINKKVKVENWSKNEYTKNFNINRSCELMKTLKT